MHFYLEVCSVPLSFGSKGTPPNKEWGGEWGHGFNRLLSLTWPISLKNTCIIVADMVTCDHAMLHGVSHYGGLQGERNITKLHMIQKLGFASCERQLGATEGINVLIEKKTLDGRWAYGVSCIEYTEFNKFGITNGSLTPKR